MITDDEIKDRVTYHPPDERKKQLHQMVRMNIETCMLNFNTNLPEGREKALVFTNLEQAMFWANAAIARSKE